MRGWLHATTLDPMAWEPGRSVWLRTANVLLVASSLAWPGGARGEPRVFVVDPLRSRVVVHVGKAGIFGFAGHEHDVVAPLREGEIVADASDLARSSVRLDFDAADLRVLAGGEPPADTPKVQQTMAGPGVLDTARFPRITFRSEKVSGRETSKDAFELHVSGPLQIRDHSVRLDLALGAELHGDTLVVTGKAVVQQSSFGITPVSVAGVVKVKDKLDVDFRLEARAQ